jgi:uncharacterized protein (TIGR02246 family)
MNILFSLCLSVAILTGLRSPLPVASAPTRDEGAVNSVLRAFEEAWNRHDMDSLANLFADDADFVNVLGKQWLGRAAIKEAHVASHTTILKNSRLAIGQTSVRFLKPDVAVTRSRWDLTGHTTPAGVGAPPRKGILTNVLVKSKGRWQIVVTQNTDIVPDA